MDDAGHALAKGLIGAIPLAGASAAEIFALIFAPPLEKRRDIWLGELAKAINELQRTKGVELADLQNDERFISLVLNATQVALRNHHKLKLDYLRQAIVSGHSIDGNFAEDEVHLFVRLIDELSPSQLRFAANIKAYSALEGHVAGVFFAGATNDPQEGDWIAAPMEEELILRCLYEKADDEGGRLYRLSEFGYRFMLFLRGEETKDDREWMDKQRAQRKPLR